jgi:hypothetical protein
MDFQAALSVADAAAVELPSAAGATIAIAMLFEFIWSRPRL